jgi:hypothetical protein
LRHVPDDLHRKLKARAAIEGMPLSGYIIREVRQLAEKPTMGEMMERLARLTPVHSETSPVEILRVYLPGREPEGYWERLQHVAPQPLIEPEKLKTQADWLAAGRRVFDEAGINSRAGFRSQTH